MSGAELLVANLLSPIVLAFVLGTIAGFLRPEIELPDAVLKLLSITFPFDMIVNLPLPFAASARLFG